MPVSRSGGTLKVVTGSDPAAGAECSDAVPAGKVWRLIGMLYTLVTDANAATRRLHITLDDGTTVFKRHASNASQAASLTQNYSLGGSQAGTAVLDLFVTDPFPTTDLPAGAQIKTVTVNKQAGDNYAAPKYYIEEFDAP